MFGGGPISWSAKRQSVVATSSTEAEYIGQFNAGMETRWLRQMLAELGYSQLIKTLVLCTEVINHL
jgi:hypothetical protein